MSDAEQILAVLAGFYAAEGAYWVRPGSVLFVSQFGERSRLRTPYRAALLSNRHGGLVYGNLLPFGRTVVGQPWPFALSPDGVVAATSVALTGDGRPDQSGEFCPFGDLKAVAAEGKAIHIDGRPFVAVNSAGLAKHLADLLRSVADTPAAKRAAAIDREVARTLDVPALRRRLDEVRQHTRGLRVYCLLLLAFVFGLVPTLLSFRVAFAWWQVAVGYAGLLLLTMIEYVVAHRALLRSRWVERLKHLAIVLVSPADAMHTRDGLCRESLEEYHPLAMAAILTPRERFERFARHALLDLRYPLPPSPHEEGGARAKAAEEWFRGRLLTAVEAMLSQGGLDPAVLVAPPTPEGADCRTYCPRCRGQFVLPQGTCPTCGRELIPFGP